MHRERREHLYHFTFSFDECIDIDEGINIMNRIKKWILYQREKNNWMIDGVIGLSYGDARYGEIMDERTGKQGRPKKTYQAYQGYEAVGYKKIHIHAKIRACPGATFCNSLCEYSRKKFGKAPYVKVTKTRLDEERIIFYLDKQCVYKREMQTEKRVA